MSALITGDLHFSTNPQDEYRWGIFDWLCTKAEELQVQDLILLGDYTGPKDNHPAALVNRLTNEILNAASRFKTVTMIAGNHDYVNPEIPFFMFLEHLKCI